MAEQEIKRVCIIGGGAAGVGLAWSLGRATKLGLNDVEYHVTLIHDQDAIGGHSWTQPVEIDMGDGTTTTVNVDCGVQAIAPAWYPMTMAMLELPEFHDVGVEPLTMTIACAFPGDGADEMVYWGNFGDYLDTDLAKTGAHDCAVFEGLLKAEYSLSWVTSLAEKVDKLIQNNAEKFTNGDPSHFVTYFLDGYMSVLNGYGNALLDELVVGDLAALWDLGYASFLSPITDYGRFKQGAMQWVNRMWTTAADMLGADNVDLRVGTLVQDLYPSDAGPTITTTPAGGGAASTPEAFDVVVSTIDMRGNAEILQNDNNPLWESVFEPVIGTPDTDNSYATSVWDLNPGFCSLHQDHSFLAATPHKEVMQFNTLPGRIGDGPGFDLVKSHSTYIVGNLNNILDVPDGNEWYVSMFGYVPDEADRPKKEAWSSPWTHGMFLPTFYLEEKLEFHKAQSISDHQSAHRHQQRTGIFFAGNNLVMDAEEGALISGMAIAKYAFGIEPMPLMTPANGERSATLEKAELMFDAFYDGIMFPSAFEQIIAGVGGAVLHFLEHWVPVIGPGHHGR